MTRDSGSHPPAGSSGGDASRRAPSACASDSRNGGEIGSPLPVGSSAAEPGRAPGDAGRDVNELVPLVYGELRRIAHHRLRAERDGHTLNTTGLVHETYLQLAGYNQALWRDRSHFLSIAAQAMRRVLVDYAAARNAQKRNGRRQRVSLDGLALRADPRGEELLAVDEALGRLERLNPRLARVVECRFFAGLGIEETAGATGTSPATVKRDWAVARAWLNRELSGR
jgi:RNA polymerase sigma factor (TIGR02999 family)